MRTKSGTDRNPELAHEDREKQKAVERRRLQLGSDLNKAFATSEGIRALQYIMALCGYQESDIALNPQAIEVNEKATIYNAMRRTVYIELRKWIKTDTLKKVEYAETKTKTQTKTEA